MAFLDISLFREPIRLLRTNPRDEAPLNIELARELEDLRKVSLNLLMAFLTVNAVSASHGLAAATLALLVYTINLHILINTRFLQSGPALSRFLHIIPLVGIFCMAVFRLVAVVQSPAIAAAAVLACVLPPLMIAVHFVERYAASILMPVPPGRDETPAPGSAEA